MVTAVRSLMSLELSPARPVFEYLSDSQIVLLGQPTSCSTKLVLPTFVFNLFTLQMRHPPPLLIQSPVPLNRKLVNSSSIPESNCLSRWKYFCLPVYFYLHYDARREKGPLVCLTLKMLPPHNFPKSNKAFIFHEGKKKKHWEVFVFLWK